MYNVWSTTVILIVTMYTEFVLYYTMLIVLNKFNSIQKNAFILSESKSGYVLDWTLYAGKTENAAAADDDASVTHRIVRSLMAVNIGKGHELYIDSYYTSVPIAVELSTQLSQYIENSMSSVVGSGTQGSPDVKQLITQTIGPLPIIQATICEVTVDCLVDDWPTPYHTSYDR